MVAEYALDWSIHCKKSALQRLWRQAAVLSLTVVSMISPPS